MTQQETFNLVVAHLRKQGTRAMHDDNCAYRDDSGRKCAIGCLIPDDDYDDDLEGWNADDRPVASILRRLGHDVILCAELQRIHDSYQPRVWESEFEELASARGLIYRPV